MIVGDRWRLLVIAAPSARFAIKLPGLRDCGDGLRPSKRAREKALNKKRRKKCKRKIIFARPRVHASTQSLHHRKQKSFDLFPSNIYFISAANRIEGAQRVEGGEGRSRWGESGGYIKKENERASEGHGDF